MRSDIGADGVLRPTRPLLYPPPPGHQPSKDQSLNPSPQGHATTSPRVVHDVGGSEVYTLAFGTKSLVCCFPLSWNGENAHNLLTYPRRLFFAVGTHVLQGFADQVSVRVWAVNFDVLERLFYAVRYADYNVLLKVEFSIDGFPLMHHLSENAYFQQSCENVYDFRSFWVCFVPRLFYASAHNCECVVYKPVISWTPELGTRNIRLLSPGSTRAGTHPDSSREFCSGCCRWNPV